MAAFGNARATKVTKAARLKEDGALSAPTVPGRNGSDPRDSGSHAAMLEKTQEFFQICDIEDKGFITRRDMQRLHGELPLSAEELENVFDTLDADGNGYLTLEEFSSGFSHFLFGRRISVVEVTEEPASPQSPPEALYQSQWEERLAGSEDDEEKHFCILMESLGANNVFEDPGEVRSLWAQLRRDEPHLLSNFEEFLARVTVQINEANQEKREMESALKRKAATHDDEIQRLYEEMEQQIKNEKDRILLQDSERFMSRSQDLEYQLSHKELELEQLFQKQRRLELQCRELHSEQHETKVENVKLKQTNEELLRELEHTCQELALAQEQLTLLQVQASRLHDERELELYRVTEGMQRERASLLKQLDLLREMNKHLRDERDMCFLKPKNSARKASRKQRSGSIGLKYSERKQSQKSEDEEEVTSLSRRKDSGGMNGHGPAPGQEGQGAGKPGVRGQLGRIISIEEDHLPQLLQDQYEAQLQEWSEEEEDEEEEHTDLEMSNIFPASPTAAVPVTPEEPPPTDHGVPSPSNGDTPSSPRGQPVGKETVLHEEGVVTTPDRLFKIVLVGNSSVGKTSLLRRFCDDCFYPGTSATVGIDYSVKTLTVENSQVALQMWDTAGQERYRSITKQFFRKADGVVVMYDITSVQTFTAVRQWLTSVQEGAGEDVPIMLLGNKTDKESEREVQDRVGDKLAKDSQLIFYECSALSGHNVVESMVHLAKILKEQEDREKQRTVQLVDDPSRKKSCCSRM
ncbi:ras and EF-hand domain-containing protein homolog [Megalops cyprinoides]|uniref:ras and EF-hand domain-containing protein homolog n=1 Tax=Megalops cyprinoides TaxID=118141 RepID=UPI00186466FD|nr:ras and EF-hand domain-containing protein homolog [Megalops cyprinoides]XP_036374437.1 ras and EF-hand domain-containing protein homolog [Megalops cyprinoides]